jgi:hypothetical protein
MGRAVIKHSEEIGTLNANDPRPLFQAINALNEEYGWCVNYEDPPYSEFDMYDSSLPDWRASHPNARGARTLNGGGFHSEFPEPAFLAASDGMGSDFIGKVLQKLVSDYNASGNPGQFTVRKDTDGRYDVIGVSSKNSLGQNQATVAILDTPISLPNDERDAIPTFDTILAVLSKVDGVKVWMSGGLMMTLNPLTGRRLTIGGSNVPARTLLYDAFQQANNHLAFKWSLMFDPDEMDYILAPTIAARWGRDMFGETTLNPIRACP